MPYFSHDTIAQIGTPPGAAAVGAIRLSGEQAFSLVRDMLDAPEGTEFPAHRTVLDCRILLPLSRAGAEGGQKPCPCPARLFLMPAPASYTREDVAEIHLPGSPALLRSALKALVRAGAREAAPGEFTWRAFRSGRLSLAQAEAVEEVIRAGRDGERRQALARLGDRGRERIRFWRDRLMDLAAAMEAALDFSEEELDDGTADGILRLADELATEGAALDAADHGAFHALPHVALVGVTNAGKSSLFNALLGEEAVLVSSENSTTRDSVRRQVTWNGAGLVLSDNPGHDPGETGPGGQAAHKAMQSLGGEDLACWVVDASRALDKRDEEFAAGLVGGVVVALTKTDRPAVTDGRDVAMLAARHSVAVAGSFPVSAASGEGLDRLRASMADIVSRARGHGGWNRRETFELAAAAECCRTAACELAGAGRLELAAEDLRRGVAAFSRALGEGYAEEALRRIFSSFCIGK